MRAAVVLIGFAASGLLAAHAVPVSGADPDLNDSNSGCNEGRGNPPFHFFQAPHQKLAATIT